MTSQPYNNDTPSGIKNAKKVQIFLKELADVYGTEWTTTLIDTATNEQKKDWFLRLNPNGRISIIIDNTQSPPFPVMETSAELLYLLKFDKDYHFSFKDELLQSELLQWLFFWHGSGAPYQGNLRYFRVAKEQSQFAIDRFRKETHRVYGVLEIQLSGKYTNKPKQYLVESGGGRYSIADIGTWAWVKNHTGSGFTVEDMKEFPFLMEWVARIGERKAVKRGIGERYKTS